MTDRDDFPRCRNCEHWGDYVRHIYELPIGVCDRMDQSSGGLMHALKHPDGSRDHVAGIAYPYHKRANLLTHAGFGCILHSDLETDD